MKPSRLSPAELRSLMRSLAGLTDLSGVAALESSAIVDEAKGRSGALESARLVRKLGAGSMRAREAERRTDVARSLAGEMTAESERATVPAPGVDAGTFAVYGRVITPDSREREGLTISLVNRRREILSEARTDDRGRFAIVVDAPSTNGTESDEAELASPKSKRERGVARARKEAHFLTVSTERGEVVHRDEEALLITGGRSVYREIVLKRA